MYNDKKEELGCRVRFFFFQLVLAAMFLHRRNNALSCALTIDLLSMAMIEDDGTHCIDAVSIIIRDFHRDANLRVRINGKLCERYVIEHGVYVYTLPV